MPQVALIFLRFFLVLFQSLFEEFLLCIVLIDVAVLTETFSVGALFLVFTLDRLGAAAELMVTVIAHALCEVL